MGIVADQLHAEVEIDGDNVTFTHAEGSAEGIDGMTDCIVAGTFTEAGTTVTMVYPDGEYECT